jgi:hypothetical protein
MELIQEEIKAVMIKQVLEAKIVNEVQIDLDGTAQASEILVGKTAYVNSVKTKVTGTMPIYDGAVEIEPSTVEQTLETENKFNANNIVAKPVTSAIDGNIVSENIKKDITILGVEGKNTVVDTEENVGAMTPNDLMKDKIGYVNGNRIIGSLEINLLDPYEDYLRTYDSGYYKQSLAVESDENYTTFWLEEFAKYVDKLNNGGLV